MSDEHDLHGVPETSHSNLILSIVGALGTMLLFALIIFLAYYLPSKGRQPVDAEVVAERKATLEELHAKEATLATEYSVINKEEGTVRIPIERAMELVVPKLNETKESE